MPSDRDHETLATIHDYAIEAQAFIAGMDLAQFRDDRRTFHAVTRCVEVISEASRRLSADLKAQYPELPWQQIAGVGNIYRHDYDNVAADIVFNTVTAELPKLQAVVDAELARRAGDEDGLCQ